MRQETSSVDVREAHGLLKKTHILRNLKNKESERGRRKTGVRERGVGVEII